jgi:hypothetical protein
VSKKLETAGKTIEERNSSSRDSASDYTGGQLTLDLKRVMQGEFTRVL